MEGCLSRIVTKTAAAGLAATASAAVAPKPKIKLKADYFNTFITMNFAGKNQLVAELQGGILTPMIQYGAQQLLADMGITNVYSFVIGPDYTSSTGTFPQGKGWDASKQLEMHLANPKFQATKYTFCSFATLAGNHSVMVLIHRESKKIYCIDSMGVNGPGQLDAVIKLTAAKNKFLN